MTKSFTTAAARQGEGPIAFEVDGETFYAARVMPSHGIEDLAQLANPDSIVAQAGAVAAFLDTVLLPESAERFAARMKNAEHPIGVEDAAAVVTWLTQDVYAMRPTVPSSPSVDG